MSLNKYFKIGDIVMLSEGSVWGKTKFIIKSFHGNYYLPLATVLEFNKPDRISNLCNFNVRTLKLINAEKRPFAKLEMKKIIKLMNSGILEAKREFMIRVNKKKF